MQVIKDAMVACYIVSISNILSNATTEDTYVYNPRSVCFANLATCSQLYLHQLRRTWTSALMKRDLKVTPWALSAPKHLRYHRRKDFDIVPKKVMLSGSDLRLLNGLP